MGRNWRVKAEGIHPLRRLIYLRKEEFGLLKSLRRSLVKRFRRLFIKKAPKYHSAAKKYRLKCFIRGDRDLGNGKIYPGYEPTNIWYTRESSLWQWRRVREYWRDFLDIYDKSAMREAYRLIHS